jgi:hypothetical protein
VDCALWQIAVSSTSNCHVSPDQGSSSGASGGLCVRARCYGQLLRRAARRLHAAGALFHAAPDAARALSQALKPSGSSNGGGGGISLLASSSALAAALEWAGLLQQVGSECHLPRRLSLYGSSISSA